MPTMNAISAAELAQIQADLAATLDKDATLYPKTGETKDALGSMAPVYGSPVSVKAGMAQPTGSQLQNLNFKIESLVAWQVKFAVGTAVSEDDKVVIDGLEMKVYVLLTPRSYPGLVTTICGATK